MNDTIKAALIAGVVSIVVAVVGQLQFFSQLLDSFGLEVAERVHHQSYSPPDDQGCKQVADAGKVVIHTDGNNKSTFWFCAQKVANGAHVASQWMSVSGSPN